MLYPIQIDLGDGLVFHMTPRGWGYEEQGYLNSGLYQNDELIYTFDGYEYWDELYFSDDAMSFLVVPLNVSYIRFYERGVLMHYYHVESVLRHGGLALSKPNPFTGIREWQAKDGIYHDRANDRLRITTLGGNRIMFDLSTGLVLTPHSLMIHDPLIVVAVLLILFIIFKYLRFR